MASAHTSALEYPVPLVGSRAPFNGTIKTHYPREIGVMALTGAKDYPARVVEGGVWSSEISP